MDLVARTGADIGTCNNLLEHLLHSYQVLVATATKHKRKPYDYTILLYTVLNQMGDLTICSYTQLVRGAWGATQYCATVHQYITILDHVVLHHYSTMYFTYSKVTQKEICGRLLDAD